MSLSKFDERSLTSVVARLERHECSLTTVSLLKFNNSESERVLANEVWQVARPGGYECEFDDSVFTQV